ncbi:MAG: RND family efflux transporter MFP subunit [Limisphaerales bacterium]|jgi:multidrug efflux system membrane fusion protein
MKIFRIIIPVLVLGGSYLAYRHMVDSVPPPRRFAGSASALHVSAERVSTTNFQVVVSSQGTVQPRTRGSLIPQVTGIVKQVSPNFRDGGFFEKDELLVEIDRIDYENAVVVAESDLTVAKSNFEEESALGEQAAEDWKRLGRTGEPNALALRKPQLAKAQSAVVSAEARLARANRNLSRTEIRAPYAGRILAQSVDQGQLVTPGTVLAQIYSVDCAEIRLPLANDSLGYVEIPESYRGDPISAVPTIGPKVTLKATLGQDTFTWEGRIVRAEGSIDTRSRQLFVVAQVNDPYARRTAGQPPLKVGMFVEAEIQGRTLEKVFVLPRSSLRPNDEVLVINEKNELRRESLKPLWRNADVVVVSEGLKAGSLLCMTSLPFAANGALVIPDIKGEGVRMLESQKPRGGPGGPGGKGKGQGGPPSASGKGGGAGSDGAKGKGESGKGKSGGRE